MRFEFFSKCNLADCDFHEGNQNCSYRERTLRQESWSTFVNNLPEILDNQGFDAKIDINSSSNEPSSTWVEFSNETLLEGIKPSLERCMGVIIDKSKQNQKTFGYWDCPDFNSEN